MGQWPLQLSSGGSRYWGPPGRGGAAVAAGSEGTAAAAAVVVAVLGVTPGVWPCWASHVLGLESQAPTKTKQNNLSTRKI